MSIMRNLRDRYYDSQETNCPLREFNITLDDAWELFNETHEFWIRPEYTEEEQNQSWESLLKGEAKIFSRPVNVFVQL